MPMFRSAGRTAKVRAIWGSEVLMIAPSRFCMKKAAATISATRRASEADRARLCAARARLDSAKDGVISGRSEKADPRGRSIAGQGLRLAT